MKLLNKFLPHLVIVLALAEAVLIIMNGYNPSMQFLSSRASQVLLMLFAACAAMLGVLHIIDHFHD